MRWIVSLVYNYASEMSNVLPVYLIIKAGNDYQLFRWYICICRCLLWCCSVKVYLHKTQDARHELQAGRILNSRCWKQKARMEQYPHMCAGYIYTRRVPSWLRMYMACACVRLPLHSCVVSITFRIWPHWSQIARLDVAWHIFDSLQSQSSIRRTHKSSRFAQLLIRVV